MVAKPISTDSFAKAEWRHFLGQKAGVPISFSKWILHFYTSTELFMHYTTTVKEWHFLLNCLNKH